MPVYKTSQEWLEQSALLLQARPTTTRVTTKYSIKPFVVRKAKDASTSGEDVPMADSKPPRGALELKTYDPITGVALKYRTTKAAEVSRLILSLGRLGRAMAALPDVQEEEIAELPGKEEEAKPVQQQPQSSAPSKKKKKGKK